MNPDFVAVPSRCHRGDALAEVRRSELAPEQLLTLWVIDADGELVGAVACPSCRAAPDAAAVSSLIETALPTVAPETELPEVARLMTDYNLVAIPVVDADGRPIGVIAVDDVLELLLPDEWRRRPGSRATDCSHLLIGAGNLAERNKRR